MNPTAPIIAGIDFSASSPSVLSHALHAAGRNGTPVIAVHVLDGSSLSLWAASSGTDPDHPSIGDRAKAKLDNWVESRVGADRATIEIRRGRPAEELHRAVEEHGAALLVIAANDTTKKRLGSIASRCVRSAPCDVMVLRDWQSGDFSKVVVCCDFSPTSRTALEKASSIARENRAKLEIVHVMYPPSRDLWGELLDSGDDETGTYADQCKARVRDEMERFLEPLRSSLSEIEHAEVILESTVPSVTLTHHVQDSGADLVVLGTRGHSRIMSHFIGTNAERLMHDSPVSVLAVRCPEG